MPLSSESHVLYSFSADVASPDELSSGFPGEIITRKWAKDDLIVPGRKLRHKDSGFHIEIPDPGTSFSLTERIDALIDLLAEYRSMLDGLGDRFRHEGAEFSEVLDLWGHTHFSTIDWFEIEPENLGRLGDMGIPVSVDWYLGASDPKTGEEWEVNPDRGFSWEYMERYETNPIPRDEDLRPWPAQEQELEETTFTIYTEMLDIRELISQLDPKPDRQWQRNQFSGGRPPTAGVQFLGRFGEAGSDDAYAMQQIVKLINSMAKTIIQARAEEKAKGNRFEPILRSSRLIDDSTSHGFYLDPAELRVLADTHTTLFAEFISPPFGRYDAVRYCRNPKS